jgi:uncharacterized protein YjbJ (UPF0337 family)
MNWDRMEGKWKQRRGKTVTHWGKMMNDELAAVAGKYEELVGRLQEKYAIAQEETRQQTDNFTKASAQLKESNRKLKMLQKFIGKRRSDRESKTSNEAASKRKRSKPKKHRTYIHRS